MLLILSWSGTTDRILNWAKATSHIMLLWDTMTVLPVLEKAVDRPQQATRLLMNPMHRNDLIDYEQAESWAQNSLRKADLWRYATRKKLESNPCFKELAEAAAHEEQTLKKRAQASPWSFPEPWLRSGHHSFSGE